MRVAKSVSSIKRCLELVQLHTDNDNFNFQFSIFNFQFTNSRCSAVGSAPVSGTGGREFESRHFDQKKRTAPCEWFSFLSKRCYDSSSSCAARCEFAFSAQSASSLLVSGKRENIHLR